ncbi:uncharacterized protein LOC126234718 [Schistocerca nitens]|uniref:uncharacterized protein LOC126234718 n=1 Tax=Schistocerca nitens TaxID=7011 RepID=UPI002118FE5D|nr:uncharacterized protein LOC126234718 [Schistocerca nitens]
MQLLVVSVLAVLACASARPEAPTQQYGAPDAAPYPASGWRPEGRQFFLPSRNSGLYAPPPQQYGPPPPAAPTTTEAAETTTTELPTTTAASDIGVDGARAFAQSEAFGSGSQNGVYYLLQPDGRLQRVAYAHGPAPAPAAYTQSQGAAPVDAGYLARFHYQDLPPPGAPIYAYSAPKLVRLS